MIKNYKEFENTEHDGVGQQKRNFQTDLDEELETLRQQIIDIKYYITIFDNGNFNAETTIENIREIIKK
jgi:hypothetical protein